LFNKLYAIALNTFVETIRQPIFGVVLIATLFLMILNVGLAAFTLDDDDKLLAELGLSTLLLSGLFLSSFAATSVLTREIENKTVLTVISKPVGRTLFLVGKYLGLVLALTLAYYICFLGFFFSVQHRVLQMSADPWHMPVLVFGLGGAIITCLIAGFRNFLHGKEFVTSALWLGVPLLTAGAVATCFLGREWQWQTFAQGFPGTELFVASFLVFCAVLVLAAIALAASTRVGQIMTLLICAGVLMVGLIVDYLLSELAKSSVLADTVYRHFPNFSFFWIVDAINNEREIPFVYTQYVAGYAILMAGAALLVGVALFQRREVG
jgi:ABC-type transport system involved in multi-copper enzyme maturation permease subunit